MSRAAHHCLITSHCSDRSVHTLAGWSGSASTRQATLSTASSGMPPTTRPTPRTVRAAVLCFSACTHPLHSTLHLTHQRLALTADTHEQQPLPAQHVPTCWLHAACTSDRLWCTASRDAAVLSRSVDQDRVPAAAQAAADHDHIPDEHREHRRRAQPLAGHRRRGLRMELGQRRWAGTACRMHDMHIGTSPGVQRVALAAD